MIQRVLVVASALAAWGMLQQAASGDPLPGEVLKFQQTPLNGPTYYGHDVLSTATRSGSGYVGSFAADDFADRVSQPVLHMSWWGSYLENQRFNGANSFLISFATDAPASPNSPFSHPGAAIRSQIVRRGPLAPGSGTFTEQLISENLYQYNAELNLGLEFGEQANTVYWLTIAALVDDPLSEGPIQWGWHVRDYTMRDLLASTAPAVVPGESQVAPGIWHFQDDAVSGAFSADVTDPLNVQINQSLYAPQHYLSLVDGPDSIGQYSMDLAFELYSRSGSVPDAGSSALLLACALLGLNVTRHKLRK